MTNKSFEDETPKIEKKKYRVEIRAVKVRMDTPGGKVAEYKQGDVIDKPWKELIEAARMDKEHRVYALIEK